MVTFQEEKLSTVKDEVFPLLVRHWEEIALNKEWVKLDPDWDTYDLLEKTGALHITTARDKGVIIGYASYIIVTNLHYKDVLVADGDIFFLAPEYRRSGLGIKLLKEAERNVLAFCALSEKPHDSVYILNKEKQHFQRNGKSVVGPIMEHLGFKLIEHYYAKLVRM